MPTPVGHALGGLATAWFSGSLARKQVSTRLAAACALVAAAPDLDILLGSHRTYSHSIGAAAIVGLMAWLIARKGWQAVALAAAYASHVVLDLLAKDTAPPRGLMALWPFTSRFYISGADLFGEVSRRYWKYDEFIVGNLKATGWEVLWLAPIAALAWALNHKGAKNGARRHEEPRRHQDPQRHEGTKQAVRRSGD